MLPRPQRSHLPPFKPEPQATYWKTPSDLFNHVVGLASAIPTKMTPAQQVAQATVFSSGSTATLHHCVIKRPDPIQVLINEDELETNAPDVTMQFLAEIRAYRTIGKHPNVVGFLGCLDGIGMVLETIDGNTLLDRLCADLPPPDTLRVTWFNQLVDALTHVHSFGLSHGDLNTLNILITHRDDSVKLIDFGRSTLSSAHKAKMGQGRNMQRPANAEVSNGFVGQRSGSNGFPNGVPNISPRPLYSGLPKGFAPHEIPNPAARPFSAPEILRGDPSADGIVADAYSLGVVLICLDLCLLIDVEPEVQLEGYKSWAYSFGEMPLFGHLIPGYLEEKENRRRISPAQKMTVKASL